MRVSIVTVAFNSASTIVDTLDSVARQDHPDIEHIVIDGASTDGTMDLVRSRGSRVSKVLSEPDAGIYDAMNKGLRLCTGDVVGFLNSDDMYSSDGSVSAIAGAFTDGDVDAVHGDLVYVRRDDPASVVRHWKSSPFSPGAFSRAWCPAHPTFYVRRSVLERAGFFNTAYRVASDLDLMLRVLELGRASSKVIPQVLVRMRMGGVSNSSVRGIIRQNAEVIAAIRSHGLSVSTPVFVIAKILRRLHQFVSRP
jgi:glycosyltransferase involved in cell wall biosynthesis